MRSSGFTIVVSKRSAFGIAVAYTERTEGVEVDEATASCILHLVCNKDYSHHM